MGNSPGIQAPRPTSLSTMLALVAAAAVIPYLLLPQKPLILDSHMAILRNKIVQEAPLAKVFVSDFWGTPVEAVYGTHSYRPAVSLSYALQIRLFGMSPALFHLVDMGLHATAAVLLALLLITLLPGSPWAGWAAALFAVHPVASEAVCSAVGRADLMAGVGLLGALVLHLRAGHARSPWRFEAGALGLLGVALLSKEYAVAFPFLLLAVDLSLSLSRRSPEEDRRRVRLVWAGAFGLLAGYLLLRLALFGALGGVPMISWADHPLHGKPLSARFGTASWLLVPSLRLLFAPYGLNYFYSLGALPIASGLFDPRALLGAAILAALGFGALRELVLKRDPLPTVAVCLFAFPLAPSLNTVSLAGVLFAERFLYLPIAGLAVGVFWALTRWVHGRGPERIAWAATSLVLVLFAGATTARVGDWRSAETITRAAIAWYPRASDAWFELGLTLGGQGRHAEAAEALARSVQLKDDRAVVWRNYAVALGNLGRHGDAAAAWRRALALSPPDLAPLWKGLGDAELRAAKAADAAGRDDDAAGPAEEAVRALSRAHELAPQDGDIVVSLAQGQLLLAQERLAKGHPDDAVSLAEKAADLGPLPPEGLYLAGLVINRAGEPERARPYFDRALQQDPDLLRKKFDVAVELYQQGRAEQAIGQFREILVVRPDHAPTLFNLGAALIKAGRPAEAIGYLQAGLDITPDPGARALLLEARRRVIDGTGGTTPVRSDSHAP